MEKCEICGSKFKDVDLLLNHIRDEHGNDKNELMVVNEALCTELGVTESQINVIKATVAKGATDAELMYFLHAAKGLGLSPINKEIYFTKMGGKVTLVTGRDGYLKIAQNNPLFKGLYSAEVCEKDDFAVTTITSQDGGTIQDVKHSFSSLTSRGKVVGAWARAEMDGQAPVLITTTMEEYDKKTTVWKQYPAAMIRKTAEAIVLKRVCGISGMVTAAEIADKRSSKELQEMEIHEDLVKHMKKPIDEAVLDKNGVIDVAFEVVEKDERSNTPSIEPGRCDKT